MMVNERARERRWIVLSTDGRHVSLGRNSDPTEEEVLTAERALARGGLAGWLAVMEGAYYGQQSKPRLFMVRPLALPTAAFEDAAAAFEAVRIEVAR